MGTYTLFRLSRRYIRKLTRVTKLLVLGSDREIENCAGQLAMAATKIHLRGNAPHVSSLPFCLPFCLPESRESSTSNDKSQANALMRLAPGTAVEVADKEF